MSPEGESHNVNNANTLRSASMPNCTAGRTESVNVHPSSPSPDLAALLIQLASLPAHQRAAIAALLAPSPSPLPVPIPMTSPALPRPDDACPLDRQLGEGV